MIAWTYLLAGTAIITAVIEYLRARMWLHLLKDHCADIAVITREIAGLSVELTEELRKARLQREAAQKPANEDLVSVFHRLRAAPVVWPDNADELLRAERDPTP